MNIYNVNTFTNQLFSGNPAAVVILKEPLSDQKLQAIATENNQPVTAFITDFILGQNKKINIRWFTPEYELNLCGHGTLAAAYIIFNKMRPELEKIEFLSPSGSIHTTRKKDLIFLELPVKNIEACDPIPVLSQGLGAEPKYVYQHQMDRCLAVFETEETIRQLKPDLQILQQLPYRGIDITAPGKNVDNVDFVSRTFYPKKIISEDPVCGASHCMLVPYWAKQLKKTQLHAYQVSERGGELFCELHNDRILLGGRATLSS
jgi:PhzF family phenazine biosynthesis protein